MILCDFSKVFTDFFNKWMCKKMVAFCQEGNVSLIVQYKIYKWQKDRKCGRCNTLSVIICLIVVPRVLHTHRCITSNQLNSMVPSRCWIQESHTFSVFRLRQRLAMVLKQFGNRKCLSFVSDRVQYILSHVVSELEN